MSGVGEMEGVGYVTRVDGVVGIFAVFVFWFVMSGDLWFCCLVSRSPSSPLFPFAVGATAWAALDSVVALSAVA